MGYSGLARIASPVLHMSLSLRRCTDAEKGGWCRAQPLSPLILNPVDGDLLPGNTLARKFPFIHHVPKAKQPNLPKLKDELRLHLLRGGVVLRSRGLPAPP